MMIVALICWTINVQKRLKSFDRESNSPNTIAVIGGSPDDVSATGGFGKLPEPAPTKCKKKRFAVRNSHSF